MRIICDHCSRPISGTVKKIAGNLNFHPDCLADSLKKEQSLTQLMTHSGAEKDHAARTGVKQIG